MSQGRHQLDVRIHIDARQWLTFYRQPNAREHARATDGRLIELQALKLQAFVSHSGVSGTFRLTLDGQNKLLSIQRIENE